MIKSKNYIEKTTKCSKCGKVSLVGMSTEKSHEDLIMEGYQLTTDSDKYIGFYKLVVIEDCKQCDSPPPPYSRKGKRVYHLELIKML